MNQFHPKPKTRNFPNRSETPKIYPAFNLFNFYLIKLCKAPEARLEIYFSFNEKSPDMQSENYLEGKLHSHSNIFISKLSLSPSHFGSLSRSLQRSGLSTSKSSSIVHTNDLQGGE